MPDLKELVKHYVRGQIEFLEFRREIVRYLSVPPESAALETLADLVDSECSDFSEGYIRENELKTRLAWLVFPAAIYRILQFQIGLFPDPWVVPQPTSGTFSNPITFDQPGFASTLPQTVLGDFRPVYHAEVNVAPVAGVVRQIQQ